MEETRAAVAREQAFMQCRSAEQCLQALPWLTAARYGAATPPRPDTPPDAPARYGECHHGERVERRRALDVEIDLACRRHRADPQINDAGLLACLEIDDGDRTVVGVCHPHRTAIGRYGEAFAARAYLHDGGTPAFVRRRPRRHVAAGATGGAVRRGRTIECLLGLAVEHAQRAGADVDRDDALPVGRDPHHVAAVLPDADDRIDAARGGIEAGEGLGDLGSEPDLAPGDREAVRSVERTDVHRTHTPLGHQVDDGERVVLAVRVVGHVRGAAVLADCHFVRIGPGRHARDHRQRHRVDDRQLSCVLRQHQQRYRRCRGGMQRPGQQQRTGEAEAADRRDHGQVPARDEVRRA